MEGTDKIKINSAAANRIIKKAITNAFALSAVVRTDLFCLNKTIGKASKQGSKKSRIVVKSVFHARLYVVWGKVNTKLCITNIGRIIIL